MKILIIGNGSWDDTNSLGNTLSNWFEGWENTQITYFYNRDSKPRNKCCSRYCSVTIIDIVKNLLSPWKIGRIFTYTNDNQTNKNSLEASAINNLNGWKRKLSYSVFEVLYNSRIWMNKRVKNYIKETNPDIVFSFAVADPFSYHIIKYLKHNTKAKIVLFAADDVYGVYKKDPGWIKKHRAHHFEDMIKKASKIYGASKEMCEAYNKLFGVELTPLYKGCEISSPRNSINNPIKMLYAGNLHYGRELTLMKLADAVAKENEKTNQVQLDIYSNLFVPGNVAKSLNNGHGSSMHDVVPFEIIKKKMQQSDIVLHVESFELSQKDVVRYSFSTKIIDCLQSGSILLAIGPKGVASIEYPRQIPGAIVVDDLADIESIIADLLEKPDVLLQRAEQINKYAEEKHEISNVRKQLQNDFCQLITF